MPTTLTLKNIPDAVYARLKASAQANRRSLNSEAIVCLEAVLLPDQGSVAQQLERARALRHSLRAEDFTIEGVDALKRAGRT